MVHAINVCTILPSVVKVIGGIDYYAWLFGVFAFAPILGIFTALRVIRLQRPKTKNP